MSEQLKKALFPEDLAVFFVERANAGDVEGLVSLYEPNAVLVINSNGDSAIGKDEIRDFYTGLLSSNPQFTPGKQQPAIKNGHLALTSSKLVNGFVTAEVARLQSDGTWLWIIDQPVIAIESNDHLR